MGHSLGRLVKTTDWVFPRIARTYDETHDQLITLPCEEVGTDIPAMLVAPKCNGQMGELRRMVSSCAIYFHPNAVDIGDCIGDMEAICDGAYSGDAMVIAPEYPGYGMLGEYEPSVDGIDIVAMATWRFCVRELGFGEDRVMLWGRSIGCGPATRLANTLAKATGEKKSSVSENSERSDAATRTDPPPVGALLLIAPFVSIQAVVEHHTTSPFLASIVGPMWQVLEDVKDSFMREVALCIVHPSQDQIVPSDHGLTIFQQSACRRKYGVWLSNAGHNFQPEEGHFVLVKKFLSTVITAHQLNRKLKLKKEDGTDDESDMRWQTISEEATVDPETSICDSLATRMLQLGDPRTTGAMKRLRQGKNDVAAVGATEEVVPVLEETDLKSSTRKPLQSGNGVVGGGTENKLAPSSGEKIGGTSSRGAISKRGGSGTDLGTKNALPAPAGGRQEI
eukprot:TRINITY_DN20165_c0_g1_i1.p1 TRINITY_DN20165_c0_g1~~TRINITY_DN20165_c0_g1_i1.p1  ORF type:complete len:450 (+),score=75.18 TRINITY_DN20165_c0_g1_i1:241-1590(+)